MSGFKVKSKSADAKRAANSRRGRTSRAKGAAFERKLAALFEDITGYEFVRTPQSGGFAKNKEQGAQFRGDILPVDGKVDFLLHIEAKNTKTWAFPKWMAQAESDCPAGKIPVVVAHKFGTSKMYALIDLEHLLRIIPPEKIIGITQARQDTSEDENERN